MYMVVYRHILSSGIGVVFKLLLFCQVGSDLASLAGFRLTDLATLNWIEAIVLCKFFLVRCVSVRPPTLDQVLSRWELGIQSRKDAFFSFLHRFREAAIVE